MSDTGFYRLEKLDGTHLTQTFVWNRLKRFFTRQFREDTVVPEAEHEDGEEDGDKGDDEGNGHGDVGG